MVRSEYKKGPASDEYTRPKTKRSLTIRHATTMIPRVTIPASGSGQIRRKARREQGRER